MPEKDTLVVNLYAGPGSGKSTTAAGIFFDLKNHGINTELATEYAKDCVYENRTHTFENQIYIFAKQHHRIFRLLDKVDVVITDSPILLSPIYDAEKRSSLENLVVSEHLNMWTYNVFLRRVKEYNPKGRYQTEGEARIIDAEILNLLDKHRIPYEVFEGTVDGKNSIVGKILKLLT
jgi:hypothetical protein